MKPRNVPSPSSAARSLFLAVGALVLSLLPLQASVSLEVFFNDGNLSDGTIAVLVADVDRDGFLSLDDPTVPGTVLEAGQFIGTGDDIIVAVLEADAGAHWDGGAGIADPAERIDYAALGISEGTPLILYLFPDATGAGDILAEGDPVVRYRNTAAGGSGGDIAFAAPADSGIYTLSALISENGGNFDPQNLSGSELYDQVAVGGEDHGGTRATATRLTSANLPTDGSLTPSDSDYFTFSIESPSRVVIYSTGTTDTVGELLSSDGSPLNDPAADGDRGDGSNFRIEALLSSAGPYFVNVTGAGGSQTGDYAIVYELIPIVERRPDATIGRSFARQKGDDFYNTTGANQSLTLITRNRRTLHYYIAVQNDGEIEDTIAVAAKGKSRYFHARYYQMSGGTTNVTGLINRTGYPLDIASRGQVQFKLRVRPTRQANRSRRPVKQTYRIHAESGSLVDTVRAIARK